MDQLDLFEDRELRYARALRALDLLDFPTARKRLDAYLEIYPNDAAAQRELQLAVALSAHPPTLQAGSEPALVALRQLEHELPDRLLPAWHRRMAHAVERLPAGPHTASVGPAGLHWLLAAELEQAAQSLRVSLAEAPGDGLARAYLADVLYRLGHGVAARNEYLRAFLDAPAAVDLERLADPDVAVLPLMTTDTYRLVGAPASWVAAVGVVEGVFTLPPPCLPDVGEPSAPPARSNGARFYRQLLAARDGRSAAARALAQQALRRLAPTLASVHFEQQR
ncbi:MAG: hypothetical protein JRI68_25925 [Deltaproteobacteria bacterium]|nr:hypothetical protein [Deltaproteobacteria bacterium]